MFQSRTRDGRVVRSQQRAWPLRSTCDGTVTECPPWLLPSAKSRQRRERCKEVKRRKEKKELKLTFAAIDQASNKRVVGANVVQVSVEKQSN
jgi:hypothetical protein